MWAKDGAVLLIDEIDKSDDGSRPSCSSCCRDYQISIPELGAIKARSTPTVFLTSNNTPRDRRRAQARCLHLFIPFPGH